MASPRSSLSWLGSTSRVLDLIRSHKISITATVSILHLYIIRRIYLDYSAWYDLGAGGLPHSFAGYLMQCVLRLFASNDLKSTSVYEYLKKLRPLERQSFLPKTMPKRKGPAPTVTRFVVPARQLQDVASKAGVDAMDFRLEKFAAENSNYILKAPSRIEGGYSDALFITNAAAEQFTQHIRSQRGPSELFHLHHSEGSAHAILSASDAQRVLESGWGERHRMSGRRFGLPINYIMIYAPRNEEEAEVQMLCAKAAAAYALDGAITLT